MTDKTEMVSDFSAMTYKQLAELLAHYLSSALVSAQYSMTEETMHDALGLCDQVTRRKSAPPEDVRAVVLKDQGSGPADATHYRADTIGKISAHWYKPGFTCCDRAIGYSYEWCAESVEMSDEYVPTKNGCRAYRKEVASSVVDEPVATVAIVRKHSIPMFLNGVFQPSITSTDKVAMFSVDLTAGTKLYRHPHHPMVLPDRPHADDDEQSQMTDYEIGLGHGAMEMWDKIAELNK